MTELPIVCSLDGAEFSERSDRWRAIGERALIAAERTETGARRRYRADREVEAELRELIALEAECCAFLDFELRLRDGELVLEVTGPPEAAETVRLFAPG